MVETNKLNKTNPAMANGIVKLYAQGKIGILFNGEQKFDKIAQQCFSKAVEILPKFDVEKFIKEMSKKGVPKEAIKEFVDSYDLHDDVWVRPQTHNNW